MGSEHRVECPVIAFRDDIAGLWAHAYGFPCHRLAGASWGFLAKVLSNGYGSVRQRHPDSKPDKLRETTEGRAIVLPYVGPDALGGGRALAWRLMQEFFGCGLGLKTRLTTGLRRLQRLVDDHVPALVDGDHLLHGFVTAQSDVDDVVAGIQ